jgi:hypothetical protein
MALGTRMQGLRQRRQPRSPGNEDGVRQVKKISRAHWAALRLNGLINKKMGNCWLKALYIDVTLSGYPHRASLKNMPDNGGKRTYDLWN